jgi:hypothetical protein
MQITPIRVLRFQFGRVVITPNALSSVPPEEVRAALQRHVSGDWGDVDDDDRLENEDSLACNLRLFSVYHTSAGEKFWIITEADRSSTTVLLPKDY